MSGANYAGLVLYADGIYHKYTIVELILLLTNVIQF